MATSSPTHTVDQSLQQSLQILQDLQEPSSTDDTDEGRTAAAPPAEGPGTSSEGCCPRSMSTSRESKPQTLHANPGRPAENVSSLRASTDSHTQRDGNDHGGRQQKRAARPGTHRRWERGKTRTDPG